MYDAIWGWRKYKSNIKSGIIIFSLDSDGKPYEDLISVLSIFSFKIYN